ncbi:unnamed protein product [Larinioides sclopetarius]|uniref:DNA-directed RNA polymerase I subunit RPA43 n=1 Tax=Larinioides sclopetarius TaxID=280406 RepID=A0AAV2BQV9_9ARAC
MAEKNFSCIKQVVKTVQIPLPSTFISNEICGITEILDSWKRQYSKQLQGVVVNYRNLSLSPNGFLVPNKPFVYYNVKATFDLFCPKIGDIVKGEIQHISKEHILCLIEGTISVSIHLSSDSPIELAPFICLNREILFEISSLKFDTKMILNVKGKITRKCIQLMKEFFPPPTFNSLVDTPEVSNNTDEGIGTSSESADDGLLNHAFDAPKINDDANFKKPFSSSTKSKKKSKRPKSDSESSSMDTSEVLTSDEKPKKKKKKHNEKSYPYVENYSNANNVSSNTVSSDTLIQDFSSLNHSEILEALKEEDLPFTDNTCVKKHKKKHKRDSSPSLIGEPTKSCNQTLSLDMSSLDINNSVGFEMPKVSKKRKRESESSFMDTSEQSTADEMPKKKHKDRAVPHIEKEIKNELLGMPDDDTVIATVLSLKKEISSPVKMSNNYVPENKKKSKDKKSKGKDKSKKKKGKVLASGSVLKKDKKSQKKGSKKNKLDDKQSKKHKKSKSHKKDKSDKKKKKNSSKNKASNVIKSEID